MNVNYRIFWKNAAIVLKSEIGVKEMFGLWITWSKDVICTIKQQLIKQSEIGIASGSSVDLVHPLENSHL